MKARQTLPSWRGPTRPSPPEEAHQTLPWGRHFLGRAHQTLPSCRGHTRGYTRPSPDPPHFGKQRIAGAGARLLLAPIRGQVLVSARHPQQTRECMLTNIFHIHRVTLPCSYLALALHGILVSNAHSNNDSTHRLCISKICNTQGHKLTND